MRGGKRPGAGRPKSDDPRGHTVAIRLNDDEIFCVKMDAANAGKSLSEWCRDMILHPARKRAWEQKQA